MKPSEIIRYISWYATENGIFLTTNRLVKFLYLADLYHARVADGKTLTGLPWKFVYYGPYCTEVMEQIDQAVINGLVSRKKHENKFSPDRDYYSFSCKDEDVEEMEDLLHFGVLSRLQRDIRLYGDDTPQLLDYIYFETEPMTNVTKGDSLDFSKAKKKQAIEKTVLNKIPKKKLKEARLQIKKLGEKLESNRKSLVKDDEETSKFRDDIYHKFVDIINEDELEVGTRGVAKINGTRWE